MWIQIGQRASSPACCRMQLPSLHHGDASTDSPAVAICTEQRGSPVTVRQLLTSSHRQRGLQRFSLACCPFSVWHENDSLGELPAAGSCGHTVLAVSLPSPTSHNPLRGASAQDLNPGIGQEHGGEDLPPSQKNTASTCLSPSLVS